MTIILFMVGCGGSSVVITPDYQNVALTTQQLKREHIDVVKVIDARGQPGNYVGEAQVGMFNKTVPYSLTEKVSDVVEKILDSLVVLPGSLNQFTPVTVFVDEFKVREETGAFSETGYFNCKLRFAFPTKDNTITQKSFAANKSENGMDVTDLLERLMYEGVAECATLFVHEMIDKTTNKYMASADSAQQSSSYDSLLTASSRLQKPLIETVISSEEVPTFSSGSFSYYKGGKVESGFRGSYNMMKEGNDKNFLSGYGLSLTYYQVKNTTDNIEGNFFNFGGRLLGKYFLSEGTVSPYISGGLVLAFGQEKIDYGNRTEES
ncbi:MAG: hypothetical protein HYZ33_00400, partial [Ignavibacteriales bacterium]|nr:hypothetical protein [Ignavibacteriales bacterium]